jgi:hypothetical protein
MSNPSILLRLPGEIRNRVYRHALSSPHPLEILQTHDRSLILSAYKNEEPRPEFNEVSEEFNQLKYVNKQLHIETVNLELQYNNIGVRRRYLHDDPPALRFLTWASTLSLPAINWINGATIIFLDEYERRRSNGLPEDHHIPDSAKSIARLAAVCKALPDMVVKYYLPGLEFGFEDPGGSPVARYTSWEWSVLLETLYACYYVAALRYNDPTDQLGRTLRHFKDRITNTATEWRWDSGVELKDLQAPNLHYYPHEVQRRQEVIPVLDFFFGTDKSAVAIQWMDHGF